MSKYSPEMVDAVGAMASRGLTNAQIIKSLGISTKTFYAWLKNEPEFHEAIHQNRKIVAQQVVPKLMKRAKGYTHTEKTLEYGFNKEGQWVVISEKHTKKQVPPDVTAARYILNNWDSENWADKQSMEHQIPDGYGVVVIPSGKTVKEWEESAQKLDKEGEL